MFCSDAGTNHFDVGMLGSDIAIAASDCEAAQRTPTPSQASCELLENTADALILCSSGFVHLSGMAISRLEIEIRTKGS